MPNRNIKESCRSSETLDQLSAEAERMFFRLTTVADDFGRFEADPVLLLAGCFPRRVDGPKRLRAAQVMEWRDEMVAVDLIRLYEVNGKLYGYLPTWIKHQGKPRAQQSKHPEPNSEPYVTSSKDSLQASADICAHLPANVLVSRSPIPGTTIPDTDLVGKKRRPASEASPEGGNGHHRKPLSEHEGAVGECARVWRAEFGSEMTAAKEDIINFRRKRDTNRHLKDHVFAFAFKLMLRDPFWKEHGASFGAFVRNFDKYLSLTELEKGDYAEPA